MVHVILRMGLLSLLVWASTVRADPDDEIAREAAAYLAPYEASHQMSGAVALFKRGRLCFARAYGEADYQRHRRNTTATRFALASLSKQFTAAATLLLEQQGSLSTSDRIQKYLPWYPTDGGKDQITVDHLLHHTAGYPHNPPTDTTHRSHEAPITLEGLVRVSSQKPLLFAPGTRYAYSNCGYQVLALIIQVVSRQPFEEFMQAAVFNPLGLTDTGFSVEEPSEQAVPTVISFTGELLSSTFVPLLSDPLPLRQAFRPVMQHPNWLEGSGNMYSTLADLRRWQEALASQSLLNTVESAKRIAPGLENYACGVAVTTVHTATGDQLRISHDGQLPWGARTTLTQFADDSTLIFLENTENAPAGKIINGGLNTPHSRVLERILMGTP